MSKFNGPTKPGPTRTPYTHTRREFTELSQGHSFTGFTLATRLATARSIRCCCSVWRVSRPPANLATLVAVLDLCSVSGGLACASGVAGRSGALSALGKCVSAVLERRFEYQ